MKLLRGGNAHRCTGRIGVRVKHVRVTESGELTLLTVGLSLTLHLLVIYKSCVGYKSRRPCMGCRLHTQRLLLLIRLNVVM